MQVSLRQLTGDEAVEMGDQTIRSRYFTEPSHSLPFKYFDSYERMFEWFDKHKKSPTD